MLRASDGDVIAVFAKAPVAGRVKTRLAAEIGPAGACELYRRIGRRVVAAAARTPHTTVVWYSPSGREPLVRDWLSGIDQLSYRAQPPGSLGHRLRHAFARHFDEGARRVLIIGSDCPAITSRSLSRAFRGLNRADAVIGPALDGGYYLIGLRAPQPGLFREIPWSTGGVFDATLRRARELRCRYRVLRRLRDVDTLADAEVLGLLHSPSFRTGQ
ncbi:MAG: TIGR04282 family arsenosugar biosynthesis glycosyltransferase [Gemmatimonadetes bacterium]|nr:TIGR04282 family arsenosugar biosynthesis glycosyltransferase [Gemmatimonadota bacterium]